MSNTFITVFVNFLLFVNTNPAVHVGSQCIN